MNDAKVSVLQKSLSNISKMKCTNDNAALEFVIFRPAALTTAVATTFVDILTILSFSQLRLILVLASISYASTLRTIRTTRFF